MGSYASKITLDNRFSTWLQDTKLHVYRLPPVDDWEGFIPLSACRWTDHVAFYVLRAIMAVDASGLAWNGDIRGAEEIYISGLPAAEGCGTVLLVAFKQDHAGDTFLVSPVELPHFNAECVEHAAVSVLYPDRTVMQVLLGRGRPEPETVCMEADDDK